MVHASDTQAGPTPEYPFLAVDAPTSRTEELSARLFELGATGVEIRDDTTMQKGPGGGAVTLVASYPDRAAAEQGRMALAAEEPGLSMVVDAVVGDAWRDKYKEFFKPFSLTDTLVVAPPWEDYEPKAAQRVLIMDPGRAFGTGLHATTSLVSGLLDQHRTAVVDARVLDVGTGSGILGVVALACGAATVVAIDNDADVIEVAAENAARNGFANAMHVSDIALEHIDGVFDVVVANIRSEVLISMVPLLAARARVGALVVLSGILGSERDDVMRAFAGDFTEVETVTREEATDAWVAMALKRNGA